MELACELDFPIAAHGEYRQRRFHPFREIEGRRNGDMELALRGLNHALGFPCDNMATLGHYIFTGILERFPKLRLAILDPTPVGCLSGSEEWTITPMGGTASWENQKPVLAERVLYAPMHHRL